jgi:hypothetical protein
MGNLMLAFVHGDILDVATGLAVVGLSWGLVGTGLYTTVLREASIDKSAIAVAVTSLFRSVGVSLGVTAAFVVIASAGFSGDFRDESGYTDALLLAAAGALGVLLSALTLPRRSARSYRVAAADAFRA